MAKQGRFQVSILADIPRRRTRGAHQRDSLVTMSNSACFPIRRLMKKQRASCDLEEEDEKEIILKVIRRTARICVCACARMHTAQCSSKMISFSICSRSIIFSSISLTLVYILASKSDHQSCSLSLAESPHARTASKSERTHTHPYNYVYEQDRERDDRRETRENEREMNEGCCCDGESFIEVYSLS